MASPVLSLDEIILLTRYSRPADQLRELHARGYARAYLRSGQVVLERPHFEAVSRGVYGVTGEAARARPRVKPAAPPAGRKAA